MSANGNWRNVIDFKGVLDRIALCVANEAARKFDWMSQPELYLEDFQAEIVSPTSTSRMYVAEYPLFGDRTRRYRIEVTLFRDEQSETWVRGTVCGIHLTGKAAYYMTVIITWQGKVPTVSLHNRQILPIKEQ